MVGKRTTCTSEAQQFCSLAICYVKGRKIVAFLRQSFTKPGIQNGEACRLGSRGVYPDESRDASRASLSAICSDIQYSPINHEKIICMTPAQAIRFIMKHGIILESACGAIPNLAETVTGKRIRGSWWTHPRAQDIFRLTRAVRDSDDILVCRLVHGKITYVHRRLWPALMRLAKQFGDGRLDRIREVHTVHGKHELQIVPYPQWVPADAKQLARRMSETEAIVQLGAWYIQGRSRKSTDTG